MEFNILKKRKIFFPIFSWNLKISEFLPFKPFLSILILSNSKKGKKKCYLKGKVHASTLYDKFVYKYRDKFTRGNLVDR